MVKAILEQGQIVQVISVDPYSLFPSNYARQFVDVPDDAKAGWFWDGQTLSAPPEPTVDLVDGVNAERLRRINKGSSFPVTGITDPIPLTGRAFDQTVYLALLTRAQGYKAAGVTTPVLTIRDGADVVHTLTPDQMIELVSQAMTWFESVMVTSWAMKDGTAPFEAGIPDDFTNDIHWP